MPDPYFQNLIAVWRDRLTVVLRYILKKWYLLVSGIILGAIAGKVTVGKQMPSYTSNISFVLSTDQRGGNAGLSGLAAQLGFDALTNTPDNIFSGDNIIELFKSRSLIGASLMAEIDTTHQTLLNYIAKNRFSKEYEKVGPLGKQPQNFSPKQTNLYRKVISYVGSCFSVFKKDKKLVFYIISASSTDPNTAYYISKYVLKSASNYFANAKLSASGNSVSLLQHEADSLADVLRKSYSSTAAIIDKTYNLNPSVSVQRSGSQFNQARAAAIAAAYNEVMRNLEVAKIGFLREPSLYTIIDEPELPLGASYPSTLPYIIHCTELGFLISFLSIVAFKSFYILKMKKRKNVFN